MADAEGSTVPWGMVELATELFAREYGYSGPELHSIFAPYTDVLGSYPMDDKPSRWQIFQRGFESLKKEHQREFLIELIRSGKSSDPRLGTLKEFLASGLAPTSSTAVSELDWVHVRDSWDTALTTATTDPPAAIRAARTTLESVCKHICDERSESYPTSGDLMALFKAAQRAVPLAPDGMSDQAVRQLLAGLTSMLSGIAALRNELSDAHGRGADAASPRPQDARLVVNTAFAAMQFLIDCHQAG